MIIRNDGNRNALIIQRRMTRYRLPLFELMRTRLSDSGIRLHVVSGTPTIEESQKNDTAILPWGLTIPCRYLRINKVNFVFQPIPEKMIEKQDLVIITQENSQIYNYWLLLRRIFSKTRVAFWGHGANFQAVNHDGPGEKFKQWVSTKVDWWFAYTQLSVEKMLGNGFPASRITCLNNAVDTKEMFDFRQSISSFEIESLRTMLGLKGKYVGIFIGSLYPEKRLDFLFSAADEIKRYLPDFELIVIGDGSLRNMVTEATKTRSWLYWVGAKYGREKVLYASLGQIFLNPGAVGLSVMDSFVMGLPMITTNCGIHGPEIAYIDSGYNGVMTKNSIQAFSECVLKLFNDEKLRNFMVSNSYNCCKIYSLDRMAENFCNGIIKAVINNE